LGRTYAFSSATVTAFVTRGWRTAGRYGHGYAFHGTIYNDTVMTWDLGAQLDETYVAFAFRRTGAAAAAKVLELRDAASVQVDLRCAGTDGEDLQVTRNGTQLATISNAFPIGQWVWISLRVVIDNSAGIVEVRNGAGDELLNETGLDTQATANAYIDTVHFPGGGNEKRDWDDLFIMDTSGASYNAHLPERAIRTFRPDGDGSSLDWTPNGAANRWDCVDEQETDDDSTYLSSGTVGHVNLSTLDDPSSEETIEAVLLTHRSRKDDVGTRTMRGILRSGGSNYAGDTVSLTTSYRDVLSLWEENPATSAPWSPAEVASLEAGLEVVS
jgi:hypothetical protein